jgi:hypothetical protein
MEGTRFVVPQELRAKFDGYKSRLSRSNAAAPRPAGNATGSAGGR